MTFDAAITEFSAWLRTPPGRYLLAWEQQQFDQAVADLFGFHALQIGLPEIDTLRANRMPHRWVAQNGLLIPEPIVLPPPTDPRIVTQPISAVVTLHCLAEALPFAEQSLDLVVLPHALELAEDAHHALAEVCRVLRPEGRVVITGFNPNSLWGLRQGTGRFRQKFSASNSLFLPRAGEFISPWRVKDWLRLLGFELEHEHMGCYRPPLASQPWLDRWAWTEGLGRRWWPVLGAVYSLVAVKRVRGMRLVGLARRDRLAPRPGAAAVTQRQQHRPPHTHKPTPIDP